MNRSITFWLLMLVFSHCAQANMSVNQAEDFSELAEFGKAIEGKRIVMLDELTHGEQQNFQLKAKLVRYLHQHHGFSVLLLESGIYDVEKIWRNNSQTLSQQAVGNLFYMYANSSVVQPLLDYIDEQKKGHYPLRLAGFDGRLSGELSRQYVGAELSQAVQQLPSQHRQHTDTKKLNVITQAIVARDISGYQRAEILDYINSAFYLRDVFAAQGAHDDMSGPHYMSRLLEGLAFVAQNLIGERRHDEHDIVMANNVKWLLEGPLKGKKVIIWGHFVHLNYAGFIGKHYDNLGSLLRQAYGSELYHAHIAAAQGEYLDYVSMQVNKITPSTKQIEVKLAQEQKLSGNEAVFLSGKELDELAQRTQRDWVFYSHQYRISIPITQWRRYWDGMFVINRTQASDKAKR